MSSREWASYGSALRVVAGTPLAECDRETLTAFLADLFRKEYNDVQRDIRIVGQVVREVA